MSKQIESTGLQDLDRHWRIIGLALGLEKESEFKLGIGHTEALALLHAVSKNRDCGKVEDLKLQEKGFKTLAVCC